MLSRKLKPAATVIPVLDCGSDAEPAMLFLKRSPELAFAPSHWVFPGGGLELEDFPAGSVYQHNNYQLSQRQNSSSVPLVGIDQLQKQQDADFMAAVYNAAVREAREESGLELAADALTLYSHWVTPADAPRRFATWHCVVSLAADTVDRNSIEVDGSEIVDYQWLTATEALAAFQTGELKLMPPTFVSLLEMQRSRSLASFYELIENRELPYYVPKRVISDADSNESILLYEEDVAYHSEDLCAEGEYHRVLIQSGQYRYINTKLDYR